MKFSAVFAGLAVAGTLCSAPVLGAGSDDLYLEAYQQIQAADQFVAAGRNDAARSQYEEALATLKRLQTASPSYSPKAVAYRLEQVQQKLASLPARQKAPQPQQPARPAETVEGLKQQLQQAQNDLQLLQAKLQEALAPRPAAIDPQELAQAEEKIRALEKEKDLLQAQIEKTVASQPEALDRAMQERVEAELAATKEKLVATVAEVATLTREAQNLKAENDKLRQSSADPAEIAELRKALQQEATRAEELQQRIQEEQAAWAKTRQELETAPARQGTGSSQDLVKKLEKERDELMKKLNEANRELYDVKARGELAQFQTLTNQVANLRARLEVFEARKVPFTAEELALMDESIPKLSTTASRSARGAVRELPAGAGELVVQAEAAFARRQFDVAEQRYREVLAMDPKNPVSLANLAAIQLEQEKVSEAEENLNKALEENPQDAYSLSLLGMVRFRQQDFDKALDLLSRAAQLDPNNPEIQNYLGITLSQQGQRDAAETALRKAIQLAPNYGGAHHNLAVIYASQTPPFRQLAKYHYDKALSLGEPANSSLEEQLSAK